MEPPKGKGLYSARIGNEWFIVEWMGEEAWIFDKWQTTPAFSVNQRTFALRLTVITPLDVQEWREIVPGLRTSPT